MSLLVTALVIGGGVVVAGVAARLAIRTKQKQKTSKQEPAPPSPLKAAGFALELGDVIGVGGRELWLVSGWLLSEGNEAIFAVLFSSGDEALVLRPHGNALPVLVKETTIEIAEQAPNTLESDGVRFERARRLPVTLTALGDAPEPPWTETLVCEYRGLAGESLWLLGHGKFARAWQGRALSASEIELWGGGAATLSND